MCSAGEGSQWQDDIGLVVTGIKTIWEVQNVFRVAAVDCE